MDNELPQRFFQPRQFCSYLSQQHVFLQFLVIFVGIFGVLITLNINRNIIIYHKHKPKQKSILNSFNQFVYTALFIILILLLFFSVIT